MRGTSQVQGNQRRPWLSVITDGESLVSHAGATLLVETARRSGVARELSVRLGRWRRPVAVHDPGRIGLDGAIASALGGDAVCDVAVVRAQPSVFGPVASDPTVSRLIARLAEDAEAALAAIADARATAWQRVWAATGAPTQEGLVVVDLMPPCSPRIRRRKTRAGRGRRPSDSLPCSGSSITAVVGVGSRWPSCCGLATPGRTPPSTTPGCSTPPWPCCPPPRGPRLPDPQVPRRRARGAGRAPRRGLDHRGHRPGRSLRPAETRLILRKERPHPGAQLRITDHDGLRITGFLTNTPTGCGTCPTTTPPGTGSGWSWPPSPPTCSPGAPGWPCPPPPATNPNDCGCASSPSPAGSCTPPDDACSKSIPPGPGPR
jgi:hypothetical protein